MVRVADTGRIRRAGCSRTQAFEMVRSAKPEGAGNGAVPSAGSFGAREGELAATLVVALAVDERERATQGEVQDLAVFGAHVDVALELCTKAHAAAEFLRERETHGKRRLARARGAENELDAVDARRAVV